MSDQTTADRLRAWIHELRRDASGESGRMSATSMYALADYLTALLAEAERPTPPPDAVDSLRVRLQYFVDRERGLSDWVACGRKGQTTGREPSITPSVLRELEHILRDAPPDAVTRARLEACVEPDGEIGIDFDYGPRAVVSISIGERGLGFAALIDGFSASGRKQFDHSLPSNVLDFLRAHLKGTPQ
jgi:hypothetical protein